MLTVMLLNLQELYGYRIRALRADIGEIKEFYLQDEDWKIWSIAVIAGASRFRKKEIYLSSKFLKEIDTEKRIFFIQQTKWEIQNQLPEILDPEKDPHLKPAGQLLGFTVKALDGEIGKVEDLVVNDANLAIQYLSVNLNTSGEKLNLSPWQSEKIDWKKQSISLGFTLNELHDYHARHSYCAQRMTC